MRKQNFNMVEVILAVVVITVGLTGVLVLLPTGLNAHKNAVADNTIPDLTEMVVSSLKSKFGLSDYAAQDGFSDNINDFVVSNDNYKEAQVVDFDTNPSGYTKLDGGSADKEDSFMKNTSGKFILVRHMSGPADDRYAVFSAIAVIKKDIDLLENMYVWKVFKDVDGKYVPDKMEKFTSGITVDFGGGKKFELNKADLEKKYIIPYVLEISYPADQPWDNRTKKVFRFEAYNWSRSPVAQQGGSGE